MDIIKSNNYFLNNIHNLNAQNRVRIEKTRVIRILRGEKRVLPINEAIYYKCFADKKNAANFGGIEMGKILCCTQIRFDILMFEHYMPLRRGVTGGLIPATQIAAADVSAR